MIRIAAVVLFAGLLLFAGALSEPSVIAGPPAENGINTRLWDDMLKKLVDERGRVAYRAFQQNPLFGSIIRQIAEAKPDRMGKDEKLAFYINAYNALVIKNVIDHYPISSPHDVDGFFKKITFTVGGKTMTLDALEYEHIIPYGGPYIHFGLVSASRSCPRLLQMAYTAENVRDQLRENAEEFLQDQSKNRLARHENTLYLSEIFKLFADDFKNEAGSVKNFVVPLLDASDRQFIAVHDISIDYLEYNWQLNAK